ncbi:MAG: hypothetical protein VXU50_03805, partial [Verrucomicrobiota bacterium]|nr:hypothetical protein [Verrucomicrobiota bacterium]
WEVPLNDPTLADTIVARLAGKHVKCMAFGAQGDTAKFYFYAVHGPTSALLLVEMIIAKVGHVSAIIKSASPELIAPFSAMLKAMVLG